MSGNIDAVINKCVDDIWAEYDQDESGSLDIKETMAFVKKILSDTEGDDSGDFSEEDFNACFAIFTKNEAGEIEKAVMADFIKKISAIGE